MARLAPTDRGRGPTCPPTADQDELEGILARSIEGDESAWRELVDLYSRRVYALARSRLRRDDLAQEITQSVFATIATKLADGGYREQGRFEAWLFRVTMNRVRDEARRAKRHAQNMDPLQIDNSLAVESEPRVDDAELISLRRAMTGLSDADREVVELRHHAQMSFKSIAEYLNQPVGTVLARHHRALRKLRDLIEAAAASSTNQARGSAP